MQTVILAAAILFPKPNVIPEPVKLDYRASETCRLDDRASVRVVSGDKADAEWVEEKLEDLKNILLKYLPPQCDSQNVMMVLSHLHLLEKDLQKHTLIEDDILVPVVNAMERDFAAKSGTTQKPGNDEE